MGIWLAVRTFVSVYFVALGIGVILGRVDDTRLTLGATLVALGATAIWSMMLRPAAKP